jgi:uncharacterized protein YcbK (DUF882 family)
VDHPSSFNPGGQGRRGLIRAAGGALVLAAAPATLARAQQTAATWQVPRDHSRFLWVRNGAGEEIAGAYLRGDGQPDWRVVARMQHLFRDMRAGAPGPMPVLLLDVLWLIQASLRFEKPLLLHSGYRTPQTNASLEGAARNSRHMEGQAADIQVRGVAATDLAQRAWAFSQIYDFMGVGVYPGFVHVDIGPKRVWQRGLPQGTPATPAATPPP